MGDIKRDNNLKIWDILKIIYTKYWIFKNKGYIKYNIYKILDI